MAITVVAPMDISNKKTTSLSSKSTQNHSWKSDTSFPASYLTRPVTNKKPDQNHFFSFYLKISYYVGIFPFKVVKDSSGCFQVVKWLPQGILCFVVHLSTLWIIGTDLNEFTSENIIADNSIYFTLLLRVTNTCYALSFFECVFRRDQFFKSIITQLNSEAQLIDHQFILKAKIATGGISLLYCCLSVFNTIRMEHHFSPEIILPAFSQYGRSLLFLRSRKVDDLGSLANNTTISNTNSNHSCFHWTDIVLTTIGFVIPLSKWLVVYFLDLLIIVTTVTLRVAVMHFVAKLNIPDYSYDDIKKEYKYLKGLSASINSATGLTVLMYFTDSILYFSINLHSTFTAEGVLNKIVVPLFFLSMTGWMLTASDTCLKMNHFKTWIRDMTLMGDNLLDEKLKNIVLLDELNDYPVGIEANGLFVITYAFLGKTFTTMVTYFVISLQFRNPDDK